MKRESNFIVASLLQFQLGLLYVMSSCGDHLISFMLIFYEKKRHILCEYKNLLSDITKFTFRRRLHRFPHYLSAISAIDFGRPDTLQAQILRKYTIKQHLKVFPGWYDVVTIDYSCRLWAIQGRYCKLNSLLKRAKLDVY